MKPTILVTGGLGFIGSHIVVQLLESNYHVVIIDNLSNSSITILDKIKSITGIKPIFYNCDVRNTILLQSVFQFHTIEVVIHLAGYKSVEESVYNPLLYYNNNIVSFISLLECMKQHNVNKIIFSSSASVYGNPETLPLNENCKVNPLHAYGSSKLICETLLRYMPSMHCIILRYFNPVGSHSSGLLKECSKNKPTNLFPVIMSVYNKEKDYLDIYGSDYPTPDGTAIRDYIHVIDLSIGHKKALEYILGNPNPIYEIFNLGTGKGYSVMEIIKEFETISNIPLPYKIKEKRSGDSICIYSDCKKANELLEWNPIYNLHDMVSSTYM